MPLARYRLVKPLKLFQRRFCCSAQVNIGSDGEADMLEALGELTTFVIISICLFSAWSMPVVQILTSLREIQPTASLMRLELRSKSVVMLEKQRGRETKSFARVTGAAPIPLLVAGGAKNNTRDMLKMVEKAMKTVLQASAWGDKSSLMNNQKPLQEPSSSLSITTNLHTML